MRIGNQGGAHIPHTHCPFCLCHFIKISFGGSRSSMTLLPPIPSSVVHALPTHMDALIRHTNPSTTRATSVLFVSMPRHFDCNPFAYVQGAQRPFKTICVQMQMVHAPNTPSIIPSLSLLFIIARFTGYTYDFFFLLLLQLHLRNATQRDSRALSILLTVVIPIWTRRQSVNGLLAVGAICDTMNN